MTLFFYIVAVLFLLLALMVQFTHKKDHLWLVVSFLLAVLGYVFLGFSLDFGYQSSFVFGGFLLFFHLLLLFYFFGVRRTPVSSVDIAMEDPEKERLRLLVNSAAEGFVYLSSEGNVLMVNNAASKLVGFSTEMLVGSDYQKYLSLYEERSKQDIGPYLDRLKSSDKIFGVALVKDNEGDFITVSYVLTKIHFSRGEHAFVLFLRDIEKERHIEQMRTDFVYIASHQLRAPVARMKWMAELMIEDFGDDIPSELKTQLRHFYDANNDMLDLVKELLTVSSLDSEQLKLGREDVKIEKYIDDIVQKYQFFARAHNAIIDFQKPKQAMPTIYVDPSLLTLMLDNLITNAISYSRAKVQNTITMSLKSDEKNVELTISDTGIGIEKSELVHVFDIFYRGPEAKKTRTDGTGLGLYIVKTIADLHDAQISVQSVKEKGTTFTIRFPRSEVEKIPTE